MLVFFLLACAASDAGRPDCAKVLCAADQYCRTDNTAQDTGFGTNLPECTAAPDECGGTPTCACLTECSSCTEDDGLVRCEVGP